MIKDNQKLRELFILPPVQASASTALAVPEMPPQQVVTGDNEVDAVLWLQSVVKTGNQALIDKALEAAKRIKTPMKDLGERYSAHLMRANPGSFMAALASFGFGELESQAERAIRRARGRHEALSRFGTVEELFTQTPAEEACKKALYRLKKKDVFGYEDKEAAARFAKYPALVPSTISDCLHARAYWDRLYALRSQAVDNAGDHWPHVYAHDYYCRDMLGVIRPGSAAEAAIALDHIDEDGGPDWQVALPIIRNLIASGWAAAEHGEKA